MPSFVQRRLEETNLNEIFEVAVPSQTSVVPNDFELSLVEWNALIVDLKLKFKIP